MPSALSQGEQILPFYQELKRTLRRMNDPHKPSNLGDGINRQLPSPIDAHNQVIMQNPSDGGLRMQPLAPHPQEYYRGNVNIKYFDGPLVLPPLPQGHTFMVTSSWMQMLTTKGLYTGLPSKDPHAHIAKLRSVCKSFVSRPDFDIDVIGLRVFPLSLIG